MKKLISFVMCCLLLASLAFATQANEEQQMNRVRDGFRPNTSDLQTRLDAGACLLGQNTDFGTLANAFYYYDYDLGEGVALWLDPATDQVSGSCTPALYPYHVSEIDWFIYPTRQDQVGHTAVYKYSLRCPANQGTTLGAKCTGPGAVMCERTEAYTITQNDYDNGSYVGAFFNCCVDGPFFVTIELVSWSGTGTAPGGLETNNTNPGGQLCEGWGSFYLVANGITRDPCYYENNTGFSAGAQYIYVAGEAGVECGNPVRSCSACDNHRVGDTEANPLPVVTGNGIWDQIIDLCLFCRDYNALSDDQLPPDPNQSFTAGEDVVLALNFYDYNPDAAEACVRITILPTAACNTKLFRVRSWLNDPLGTLFDGAPRFPGYGGGQQYNFTPTGLGCLLNDNYKLFIDTRGCCCPVRVVVETDATLPVNLTGFTAVGSDSRVDLRWTTAQEASIASYDIMRDNVKVGEVSGLGDAAEGHVYNFVDTQVENGRTYQYHLVAVDLNGSVTILGSNVNATPLAGAGSVVSEYKLAQNYPNPFNPTTNIAYSVKEAGHVSLKVFTVDGREVATLVNQSQEANNYSVNFDARGLASGVYLYQLSVNGFNATEKMILMK